MKHILPILMALVAAGAMGYVLYTFLKRLHQIENAFWGTFARTATEPPA